MEEKLKSLIVLFKAHQSLTKNIKVSLKDSVLTVNEFAVMEALYTKEELVTQDLIDKILIPNSSLTYVLDVLEQRDYIIRRRDVNDRRRQIISLTKNGKEVFLNVYANHFQHMKDIFNVLSEEENQELQRLLKKIGIYAEEKVNETC